MKTGAIDILDLHFSYGKKEVLSDLNVSFPKGKFSVLLGVNGSGKSTLFKIIAGLLHGYSGIVSLMGKDSSRITFKDRAPLIGFLPQFYQTVFPFNVEEILLTGRTAFSGFAPKDEDWKQAENVISELGLPHLRHANFTELSGGEQQMVMVGRLMMQNPAIIVLDEPTNHLDVYYQNHLMYKLKHYASTGHTVIAVMHNPTLAYQYADEVYFMYDKTILIPPQNTVIDIDLLKKIYNVNFLRFDYGEKKYIFPEGK